MIRSSKRWAVLVASCMAAALTVGCGASLGGDSAAPASVPPKQPATKLDGENPRVWKPRTRSVAVFKNGLGFFLREGEVTPHEGWCVADNVPPAAFGTLAIYAKNENDVVDIVGSGPGEVVEFDGRDALADQATRLARLTANRNLKVELQYMHKGQKRSATGQLVSVGAEYVAVENEAGSIAVPTDGISRMQVLDLPLRVHVSRETAAKYAGEKKTLGMAYLRKGITWIPEYTMKVIDDDTAELTLRGTVVNEAEDLIHADVHLVVGVPHFVHTEYMAPLAVGQMIRTIGAAVASQAPREVMTQAMNRAALVSNMQMSSQFGQPGAETKPVTGTAGDLSRAVGNLPQLGGAAATDYTVYTKKDLTLRRGEKAIVTLFTQKIRYSHIYRWSPPGAMEHSLVLHNQTDTAWTTGPCLALSGDRPLSEDLLMYTPKGGRGEMPVTAAINVAHEKSEQESDRKMKAYSPSQDVYFDLVVLEGKLQLANYEKRAIDIVIRMAVPGRPTAASDDGATALDTTNLKLLQRSGSVTWNVKLEPGEKKTLTYQYERYVPSR